MDARMGVCMDARMGVHMGVRTGDHVDVCRAVCRAVCIDNVGRGRLGQPQELP